jgi:putative transposase
MMYVHFPHSLRNVEDRLHERSIDVSHESVRYWRHRIGPMFAVEIGQKRAERLCLWPQWRCHLDEMFVKISSEPHYLWRAVDHEGEILQSVVSKTRDRKASLKFIIKSIGYLVEKVRFQAHPLRHPNAPEIQLSLPDARARSEG